MLDVIDFLCPYLTTLWKEWPLEMNVTILNPQGSTFSLFGVCPHCGRDSVFIIVSGPTIDPIQGSTGKGYGARVAAAMQCQGCRNYILGLVLRPAGNTPDLIYLEHYPLGKPPEESLEKIPPEVASGFREAVRCRWVKAYGATVLMCRRSLQVSCDREQAVGKDLFKQIDDLASKQKITETLKQMAHRIRLLGKQGAHGDYSDIDDTIEEKDADDAITFMRHYLDHVYVLPALLAAPPSAPTP